MIFTTIRFGKEFIIAQFYTDFMDTFSFTTPQGKTDVFYCEEVQLPFLENIDAIYITDSNTVEIAKNAKYFSQYIPLVTIKSGEQNKNFNSIQLILKTALNANLSRNALFIGIGGGVVCDLTAFAASIYKRGVKCCLVPTTLLAMVDASIGGKTAVNFQNYKNTIGTFFKADKIYINPTLLHSLNKEEYFSGLAEIFKIALLYSQETYELFFKQTNNILQRNDDIILELIKYAIAAKAGVVMRDFYEKDERAFLNFGHSFGHALETVLHFKNIPHGYAVAWGISRALRFGQNLRLTDPDYADEVCSVIKQLGWNSEAIPTNKIKRKNEFSDLIISAMKKDKKNLNSTIRLILQKNIKNTFIYQAEEKDIKAVLL